jgi:hypothetical protein
LGAGLLDELVEEGVFAVVGGPDGEVVIPSDTGLGGFPQQAGVGVFGKFVEADVTGVNGHGARVGGEGDNAGAVVEFDEADFDFVGETCGLALGIETRDLEVVFAVGEDGAGEIEDAGKGIAELHVFEGGGVTGFPGGQGEGTDMVKYFVDDVDVDVVTERTQYYGPDGKLITESLKDYTRKTVLKVFEALDSFLKHWNGAEKKQAILTELEERGVLFDALAEEVGKNFDPFDLICHVAFDRPPLSRKERAERVKKSDYFSRYEENAQEILDALLDKYADDGVENLENMSVLKVQPFDRIGTPMEIVKLFGGKSDYLAAVKGLESQLYTLEV